ncbi:MAG: hypothetical protein ABMB14_31250, partial [Myxococcota bacterium]
MEHLAERQDHRAVITLVESWAEQGAPTVPARIAAARAFLALRLVDRAWIRLKDLVETADPNLDAVTVAAEMFLLRGWPNQARKAVQRALDRSRPDPKTAAALEALRDRATEPATTLDDSTADRDNAPVGELVRVAEQYMARGAFVRARTLLERVRRKGEHRRATDLLWAIEGEFTSPDPLASLCDRWGPEPLTVIDGAEEPEHTESARVEDLRPADGDRAFPRLFRHLDEASEEGDEPPEVTAVSSMAQARELETGFADMTDHGEDTQIARVMHRGAVADTPVHFGNSSVDSGFNLADFRREMGMTGGDLASDFHGPEDEDDSVVIFAGRTEDDAETSESSTGGILLLDTADERLAKAKHKSLEEPWAVPLPERFTSAAPSAPAETDATDPKSVVGGPPGSAADPRTSGPRLRPPQSALATLPPQLDRSGLA